MTANDLEGCSLADVLQKLEKGKIGHTAAMQWLNLESLDDLVEVMHVNGRLMPGPSTDARLAGNQRLGASHHKGAREALGSGRRGRARARPSPFAALEANVLELSPRQSPRPQQDAMMAGPGV